MGMRGCPGSRGRRPYRVRGSGEVGAAGRRPSHGELAMATGQVTMATGAGEEGEMGRVGLTWGEE